MVFLDKFSSLLLIYPSIFALLVFYLIFEEGKDSLNDGFVRCVRVVCKVGSYHYVLGVAFSSVSSFLTLSGFSSPISKVSRSFILGSVSEVQTFI